MKTLALIARRQGTTRDAFRAHYEDVHAPLAVETLLEGTERYVRHHLRDVLHGDAGFDVVSAFWYRDVAAALAVQQRLEGAAGEIIHADEETFMDRAANTWFAVSEHPVLGEETRDAGLCALALVRAAPDASPETYESEWIPKLLDAVRAPAWCLQNRALAAGDEKPAFDAVTQLHAAADADLAGWALALAGTGAEVVVATVSEHESDLERPIKSA